jgi:two-component system sensor histidine kinase CpxA
VKPKFPLFVKIALWFFLNLVLLAGVGWFILSRQFGLDLLLSGPVATRMGAVTESLAAEFRTRSRSEWTALLENRSATYGVKFVLFQDDGTQLAGETISLPEEVKQNLRRPAGHPGWDGRDNPKHGGPEHKRFGSREGNAEAESRSGPPPSEPPGVSAGKDRGFGPPMAMSMPMPLPMPRPRFVVRTSATPKAYWIGMPAYLGNPGGELPRFCTLLIVSKSLYGGGLFFDAKPILLAGVWVLLFSIVFWFPLVRGITRALGQMTRAAEHIAQGRFDNRLTIRRRDELGQLGSVINRMAERLQGFVSGQKRFLGDTAHELCTPLARIQMLVGILEQRSEASAQAHIQGLREEVQHMSGLVAELLSFSKASLAGSHLRLAPVDVVSVVRRAAQRENNADTNIRIEGTAVLMALADTDLLQRALANLIRNAVRYAGEKGPIVILTIREGDMAVVKVTDSGPGVPEEFLQRLFDPFFRVDEARTREAGGVGLGLTIVKTCIEACGGTVSCVNRAPSGLEVTIRLKAV